MPLLAADRRSSRVRRWLAGAPLALPRPLDAIAEGWARAGPRPRAIITLAATLAIVAIAGRGAVRSPWGAPVATVVAAADLPAGHRVEAGDVEVGSWPASVVPDDAPSSAAEVVGASLAFGAPAGSLIVAAHLRPAGVADGLPADRVAFPLPLPEGVIVAGGERVDLLAADVDGQGALLAADARVLSVDGAVAWVAVARAEAPALAGAASARRVVVVLLPGASAG